MYDIDIFRQIEHDIGQFCDRGKVLKAGDMNARVGQTCDYINNDRPLPDNDAILIDTPLFQVSRDLTSNRFGDNLLDICKSTNLRIVNGRLNGDQGKWTCITQNGQSVVDYVIT